MDGAMIALVPSAADLDRITLQHGEPREQLHLTLFYLGDAAEISDDQRSTITGAVRSTASSGAITADAFGVAVWNPNGDDPCTVLNVGGEQLEPLRTTVGDAIGDFALPMQHAPWQPHICLAYDPGRMPDALDVVGPLTFDVIRVGFAGEYTDITLGTRDTVDTQEAAIMPWHKVHGHSGCPSSKPWAVVKDSDGSVSGCHATEDDANAQLAALYGSESEVDHHSGIDFLEVDNSEWDGGSAMTGCGGDASCYRSICAGRRDGPAEERGSWALPHHKSPGSPPNAAAVRNALARLSQTEGLTNRSAARAHLERHMAEIQRESATTSSTNAVSITIDPMTPDAARNIASGLAAQINRARSGNITAAAPAPAPAPDAGECPPGQHKMPDGSCMPDGEMATDDGSWNGVLAVEGMPSGDGRRFAEGSLVWRDLPLPLYWQRSTATGHDASVIVGNIQDIWRDGANIRGRGEFNLNADPQSQNYRDAWDAYQLVRDGFMRGVSVTIDDVRDNDVELVWPSEGEPGEMDALFMEPEEAIFHHARVIDGTLTGQPAYQEAFIQIGVGEGRPADVAVAAVVTHTTETVDDPWNVSEVLAGLKGKMTAEDAGTMYAWVLGEGTVTKSQCQLPHHTGIGGPANIAACSSAIQMLNGGRGGVDIPDADRQAVYNHLAQHIVDAGMDPPPLVSLEEAREHATLTASLHVPVTPPAAWFADPGYTEITPLQVGDDGWIRGHLAKWGTCHTSFSGTCVTPPHEDEFGYFTTGEIVTREGTRIPVGQLTLGTGHAPANLGARPAAVHYDHTGFAVADVACGADQFGIWVAGALCPDVDELTVRRLRASALSGDWRRISGQLRLVAALVVNVPGFPIPRTRSHIHDGAQSALVAAGIVQDVERQPEMTILTPRVAELVAATLREQVMGPKIKAMRSMMNRETTADAV